MKIQLIGPVPHGVGNGHKQKNARPTRVIVEHGTIQKVSVREVRHVRV